ncbi:winged helix-turn-helix transcriptional regulator [Streptomyces sp. R302]|uniref:MarR family winged helix-turn-helix transcriptional regulator n=1 Tax=unclassified Streptomyces TaxID=2593676 RepID=UPI00145E35D5|nr:MULTISPECIES: MarR family winged helix-turn-helix transcriptional regulator [unclassified Streptomyces]NML50106.1 winged helix-turn-helix transcriptional regulator [Streptomyces sp. R301]NML79097.1 winged helix-turn-helix transcriptional regulator [Streptomyces sp. R302]
MVDHASEENVNQVVDSDKGIPAHLGSPALPGSPGLPDSPGYELPLLLFGGFRTLIDRLHARLADEGHPAMRPAHGFAMQAIGGRGATASEIGRRLGVSKQAAGKTVDRLLALGYAERADDPADARRKLVRLTPRGRDALARSAAVFDELRAEWSAALGADRVRALEADLRNVVPAETAFRLDATSWLGGN